MQSIVELTASARLHAEAKGLLNALRSIVLDPCTARGDIIELSTPSGSEAFIVHARRLRIAQDGSQQLVIELDYPVHPRA